MGEWQPIASAPKDGTQVLVTGGTYDCDNSMSGPRPMTWVQIAGYSRSVFADEDHPWQGPNCGGHDEYYWYAPTHWQPLPEPPEASDG